MEEEKDLREELANYAHEAWSGWMIYLFQKSIHNDDGTITIPEWAVIRWKKQAWMKYWQLSEKEKDSDRKEADEMIKIFNDEVTEIAEKIKEEYAEEVEEEFEDIINCGGLCF